MLKHPTLMIFLSLLTNTFISLNPM